MSNKCQDCKWFEQKQKTEHGVIGECKDALSRARKVVPLSVDLSVTMVFGHSGECPAFERA